MLVRLFAAVMAIVSAGLAVIDGARSIADGAVFLTEAGSVWADGTRLAVPDALQDGFAGLAASPLVIWSLMLTGVLLLVSWAAAAGAR